MAISPITKQEAIALRKQGLTHPEICNKLGLSIPKSTMSYWFRGINLPPSAISRLDSLKMQKLDISREKAVLRNKKIRETFLEKIENRNSHFSTKPEARTLKIALAMLYLGEGSKWPGHRGLSLGSSDPEIIKLYVNLLKLCYNLDPVRLKCRVQPRADQDIDALNRYWSATTCIPLKNFYKTKPDARTVGKKTKKKDYRGVCVVSGGSTEIQLELEIIAKQLSRGISSVG